MHQEKGNNILKQKNCVERNIKWKSFVNIFSHTTANIELVVLLVVQLTAKGGGFSSEQAADCS